jgi:N-acetylmuramoyl-L-alanine amidase
VFRLAVLIFCGALAFFLAGCASTSDSGATVPPDWSTNVVVEKPVLPPNTVPIPPVAKTNLIAGVKTNLTPVIIRSNAPATNVFKPAPVLMWTSLDRWAAENKLGSVRKLSGGPTTRYFIDAKNGLLILEIGSREAIWRGMQFHLGFAPLIIDNQVFIHGLDLQKNLVPLMLREPPVFGPNRVIVIDPGHGGQNGGTTSVLGRHSEKEFTLDWARRIKPLLESNGWTVFLTRTNDVDIALSNRVAAADIHHADLFVSLHFNSLAPDQRPVGLATFCLTPAGMPSTITRGYPDIIYQTFPNNYFDLPNVEVAAQLHRALLRVTGLEDRGVNRARFMGVLRGQQRAAVLIEAGFLSNPAEARKIESGDFRQKLAEAVAEALK